MDRLTMIHVMVAPTAVVMLVRRVDHREPVDDPNELISCVNC
jgi:hypothetical protein